MKNTISRWFAVTVAATFAAVCFAFGCSDGGGGKEEPPPPPGVSPLPTKILWTQETPLDATAPTTEILVAEETEKKVTAGKSLGPPSQEEVKKEKAVGFFVSNLDGTGIARLTPTKNSAVALSKTLAPNGDFFYWTPAGIFISNFKNAVPKILIDSKSLFTKFDDAADNINLAWNETLANAYKGHSAIEDPNNMFNIVPYNDEASNYAVIILLHVKYLDKKAGGQKTTTLALKYDSKTGVLDRILPAHAFASNNIKVDDAGNKSFDINYRLFNSSTKRLDYKITVEDKTSNPVKKFELEISYDPISNKYAVFSKKDISQGAPTPAEIWPLSANLFQESVKMTYNPDTCVSKYTTTVVGNTDVGKIKARKTTALCMQQLLSGKTIQIKKVSEVDITASVSSKDALFNALMSATVPEPTAIASIDAGIVKAFAYNFSDIICESSKCYPDAKATDPPSDNKEKTYYLDSNNFEIKDNLLLFCGSYLKGNDVFKSLYSLDLSNGKVTTIDKEDETTKLEKGSDIFQTTTGPIFVYAKQSETTKFTAKFTAIYLYDPVIGTPLELVKYMPADMNVNPAFFSCSNNTGGQECYGITFDKKYAFVTFKDEMDKIQTYAKDITSLYPVPITESTDDTTKSKGAAKSVAKEEGEGVKETPTSPLPAKEAGSMLGEGWVRVNPDIDHKGITYNLVAFDGSKAVWHGNKEGFNYLYWNQPLLEEGKDVTAKRIDPAGYNSNQTMMSFASGLGLAGSAVMIPPDDLNAGYKCGASTDPMATYCENSTDVCVAGVCKDMYSCSADVPNGYCADNMPCVNGACTVCTPNCTGKVCGSDGCGGSCGTCAANQTCTNNQCVATTATCANHSECTIGVCDLVKKQCTSAVGIYVVKTSKTQPENIVNPYLNLNLINIKYNIDVSWIFEQTNKTVTEYKVTICTLDETKCKSATVQTQHHLFTNYDINWPENQTADFAQRIVKVVQKFSDNTINEKTTGIINFKFNSLD